jgi:hypothetical protein
MATAIRLSVECLSNQSRGRSVSFLLARPSDEHVIYRRAKANLAQIHISPIAFVFDQPIRASNPNPNESSCASVDFLSTTHALDVHDHIIVAQHVTRRS